MKRIETRPSASLTRLLSLVTLSLSCLLFTPVGNADSNAPTADSQAATAAATPNTDSPAVPTVSDAQQNTAVPVDGAVRRSRTRVSPS